MKFYNTEKLALVLSEQLALESMKIDNEEHRADGRQAYWGYDDFVEHQTYCKRLSKMPNYLTVDEMVKQDESPLHKNETLTYDEGRKVYDKSENSYKDFMDIKGYSTVCTEEFCVIKKETARIIYSEYMRFCKDRSILLLSNVKFAYGLADMGAYKVRKIDGMTYTLFTKKP